MKFIKIGDVVINIDLVECIVPHEFVNRVKYESDNDPFGSNEMKTEGVRVFLSGSPEDQYHVFKNETMDSMLEKLNRVPESLRMAHPPQLESKSMLHDIDCYFDNSNNTKRDADNLIQSIYENLTGEVKAENASEWEPDWSVAPDYAMAWQMCSTGDNARWLLDERQEYACVEAPSFNYTGNWQDSLRKRPQGK